MSRHFHLPVLLALAAGALAAPSAALAVDTKGTGENITHVKNIPYPNPVFPKEINAGTDLEFATLTVPAPAAAQALQDAPAAPADPATPGTPATPATPASPASPAAKGKAKSRKPAACRKSSRRLSKKAARKRAAACRKAKRRAAAKARPKSGGRATARAASLTDAQSAAAGLQRTFSFAGSYGDGLQIIDVTDPENAKLVATWGCGISQGDVAMIRQGERTLVAYTHDDGYDFDKTTQCAKELIAKGFGYEMGTTEGAGTYIADVTNPYEPKGVAFVPFEQGSHNQTVHPSGNYLYNSNSDLITSVLPAVEIVDISTVEQPKTVGEVKLKTFPGLGTESHDIEFSADGKRAYVAALSHGEILDTTNPAKPVSIGTVVDPSLTVWHQADEISIKDPILGERKFMIAEDEVAGATPTGQCPNGGVHVYDITGDLEKSPVKVGSWNIDDVGPTADGLGTCTAHVFELHAKEKLMTIAYYNGGVRVVDLSGLVGVALGKEGIGMKELGFFRFPDSDTWAVKAPSVSRSGFYLYGNDHRRGFDVYRYQPSKATSTAAGTWRNVEQTLQAAQDVKATGSMGRARALCLLNRPTAQ